MKREQISELKGRIQKLSGLEIEMEQYRDYKYLATELERTTTLCDSKDKLISELEAKLNSMQIGQKQAKTNTEPKLEVPEPRTQNEAMPQLEASEDQRAETKRLGLETRAQLQRLQSALDRERESTEAAQSKFSKSQDEMRRLY